jgi:hypothetical protein
LHAIRRFRIPAILCALAVLLCELISRPFVSMNVCDDGPYIVMARILATTGHFAYTGWAAPMLGWQVVIGALFIKLFGFSFTTVRMSTLFVAMLMAFFLQRSLVAADITERNATLGTLAFVLSPLYLLLSVTYMTDLFGLFAVVLCLYGCLRALQAATDRTTIVWLCFAVLSNALLGTSRQIAWLGILTMLPATLWLLRTRSRVLLAGAAASLAGVVFILACMHWLKLQPYSIPERLLPEAFPVAKIVTNIIQVFIELPFLIFPIMALFVPRIFNNNRRSLLIVATVSLIYLAFRIQRGYLPFLEPAIGDWVTVFGIVHESGLHGEPPVLLHTAFRVLLTIASLGGSLGLALSFLDRRTDHSPVTDSTISWRQLSVLLGPFVIAYTALLVPRGATVGISDRYVLGLAVPALFLAVRYYQDRFASKLPFATVLILAIMATLSITIVHNTFAFYRARVALAAELHAAGIPDTSIDNGWEYNFDVELQHASHINFPTIVVPPGAYVPAPPLAPGTCFMYFYDYTPHIRPLYGVAFDPNECNGLAPVAPVHYDRWFARTPGTLYAVRSAPAVKP